MTFAFGTLIFTVTAITVAPQVVMFLGLTHATSGSIACDRAVRRTRTSAFRGVPDSAG